jgi:hypothetical protein
MSLEKRLLKFFRKLLPLYRATQRLLNYVTKPFRNSRLGTIVKILILFVLIWMICWEKFYDPDFGWHLQAGDYIWKHGVPIHDLFTYTAPNYRWINHEWLSDIAMAKLYAGLGYAGLTVVYALMWSVAIVIMKGYKRVSFMLLAILAIMPYTGVRATTWTVLLLTILISMLAAKSRKVKYFIPFLFLLWVNLHGGFIIGLALLLFSIIKKPNKPYSGGIYTEIFRVTTDSSLHWQIVEWFPAGFLLTASCFIYSVVWAIGVISFFAGKWRKLLSQYSFWFFLASLSSARHFPLFVVVSLPELDIYYKNIRKKMPKQINLVGKAMIGLFKFSIIGVATLVLLNVFTSFRLHPNHGAAYPAKAADYFVATPCKGHIFASYNYGGYFVWKLPGQPVYIDGRMPSWRDESGKKYFNRYDAIQKDKNASKSKEFKTYNIKCVVWPITKPSAAPLTAGLRKAGWHKIDAASDSFYETLAAPNN